MATAIVVVLALVFISPEGASHKGIFKRAFTGRPPVLLFLSEKANGLRAVCGIENNRIYFETDSVGSIIEMDTALSRLHFIHYQIPDKKRFQSLYSTFIDSSYCYITGGNIPAIIRLELKGLSNQLYYFPNPLFSQASMASNGTFIVRAYQKFNGKWDQVFTRWNPLKHTLASKNNILKKRWDAGISTDGILLFDRSSERVLFVSYYSTAFICMDTLLKVLYRATTIDSTVSVPIKVAVETNSSSQIMTNSSPLPLVNLRAKVANRRLYIQSAIQSDNESEKVFSGNAAIDVYQTTDGSYLRSFYIPEYKSEKLKDFEVSGHTIIVLYTDYAAIYSLPFF